MVYTGNRNCQIFDTNARRLTKLEPNEIFIGFSISRDQIDEIDPVSFYFIYMDWKIMLHPTAPDQPNISEVGAE